MLQNAKSIPSLLPHYLRHCFERVVLDEAHEVRNQETQNLWTIQNLSVKKKHLVDDYVVYQYSFAEC